MTSVGIMASSAQVVAEERITIASSPNGEQSGNWELGVRVTFAVAGLVTKIRYKRTAASGATLGLRGWNSAGAQVIATINRSDVGTGAFEVTLPTPLAVAAGSTYGFSTGHTTAIPVHTTPGQSVTNTTNCTFAGYYAGGAVGNFPFNAAGALGTVYVEPIFVPT